MWQKQTPESWYVLWYIKNVSSILHTCKNHTTNTCFLPCHHINIPVLLPKSQLFLTKHTRKYCSEYVFRFLCKYDSYTDICPAGRNMVTRLYLYCEGWEFSHTSPKWRHFSGSCTGFLQDKNSLTYGEWYMISLIHLNWTNEAHRSELWKPPPLTMTGLNGLMCVCQWGGGVFSFDLFILMCEKSPRRMCVCVRARMNINTH